MKHKADVNHVYPEEDYKPSFNEEETVGVIDDYDIKGKYKCCALINVIR